MSKAYEQKLAEMTPNEFMDELKKYFRGTAPKSRRADEVDCIHYGIKKTRCGCSTRKTCLGCSLMKKEI